MMEKRKSKQNGNKGKREKRGSLDNDGKEMLKKCGNKRKKREMWSP